MWVYDSDYRKWGLKRDSLRKDDYEYLKQELISTRLYSSFLSGSTYVPVNDVENLYDILGRWTPRNWYVSSNDSVYSSTTAPSKFAKPIDLDSSYEYYTKFISEYGLTLKNLFTPRRLVRDSQKNYIEVDVSTTGSEPINLQESYTSLEIDGVKIKKGHRILVRDQETVEAIDSNIDPETYFRSEYTDLATLGGFTEYSYFNSDNGIYEFDGTNLIRVPEFVEYDDCIRLSVNVKMGQVNGGKQFHLARLKDGFYPAPERTEPMVFVEKKNWVLRHKVDYNNLFDINYYDAIKHAADTYQYQGITYSIPERTVGVGEFGVILNNQYGISSVIPNKYKVNLRSISMTLTDYWVCGDDSTLLKVRKHDFEITKIRIDSRSTLRSVSFYDNQRGSVVGDDNTILLTFDGGQTWKRLRVSDFDLYNYNKVVFPSYSRLYVGGRNGVFLDVEESASGWTVYKRRISQQMDDDDERLLVENINDLLYTKISGWNLGYTYTNDVTSPDKEVVLIACDGGYIVAYDISSSTVHDFLYMDFGKDYGDIINIQRRSTTDKFMFTANDGLYSFTIGDFTEIGIGNSYSNAILATQSATKESSLYANEIFDYSGQHLVLAGNNSLLAYATYSVGTMSFSSPDSDFENRLKSKLLFLDYDMASKLNFFTDQGDYRMPNPVSFNLSTTGGTYLSFTSSATPIQYSDGTPIVKSIVVSNVDPRTRGKVKEIRVSVNITAGSISLVRIGLRKNGKVVSLLRSGQMKPEIELKNFVFTSNEKFTTLANVSIPYQDKMGKMDLTPPTFELTNLIDINSNTISDLYDIPGSIDSIVGLWDLIVYNHSTAAANPIRLDEWSLTAVMEDSYLEVKPVEIPAAPPSNISRTELNWWSYRSDSEKTFEYWTSTPMSDSSAILMSSIFQSSISYTDKYPYLLDVERIVGGDSDMRILAPGMFGTFSSRYNSTFGGDQIDLDNFLPAFYGHGGTLFMKDYLMVLETDLAWSVAVGDVLRMESDVVDGNFIVNKIVLGATQSAPPNVVRKFIYAYTEFDGSIVNSLISAKTNGKKVYVRNLNKYLGTSDLVSNFTDHPIGTAYEMSYSQDTDVMTISSKFNSETAYYNLSTVANYSGVSATMSYESSFLKFGYSPRYNIMDYLESINKSTLNPIFYANKEYLAMPIYKGIPTSGATFSESSIYIDAAGVTSSMTYQNHGNKIVMGPGLSLEWESIFINTFIDLEIHQPLAGGGSGMSYPVNRLLVMDKYIVDNYLDSGVTGYVIEFHKRIDFDLTAVGGLLGSTVDIRSRRSLKEISDDLQELNNIHLPKLKISEISVLANTATYSNYGKDLNFKISTDSYAKIFLSDVDTVREISGMVYTDYKNELALNITRLDRRYDIPISNTFDYNGQLYISCSAKHELEVGDGVVLDFTGGEFSSQNLNQQYFGYHLVKTVVDEYDFIVEIPYGSPVFVGNDVGTAKYLKRDPFLNYQPVDIIELGVDKRLGYSIKIDPENVMLSGATFSLVNMDWNRYRFRLVDGLSLNNLSANYPWILDAEISDAVIGLDSSGIVWYKGTWESGRWFGGTWRSGLWKYGDWYGGTWYSQNVQVDGLGVKVDNNSTGITQSVWQTGRWYDGTWNDGTWQSGRWYEGTWENGIWGNGIWNDGVWNAGRFTGGIWVQGTWNEGVFNTDNEPCFWLDGTWNSGDFENGIWYNGVFSEKKGQARFGVKAFNSRTAIWYGGKWRSGSFYSGLTELGQVSDVHKYSIWYTGQWISGDWYGGIAYNMALGSGTWHGGILEDIQVIGMNSARNSFILNGKFRFNLGDEITIIDNNRGGEYTVYGSNSAPRKYIVLDTVVDETEKITEVLVATDIDTTNLSSYKVNSGTLDYQIPNTMSYLSHTLSVPYDTSNTNEIRVKINLTNQNIGDLVINLLAPNGMVINLKPYGLGGTMSADPGNGTNVWVPNPNFEMVNTIFTTEDGNNFEIGTSPYGETYNMSKELNVGDSSYLSTAIDVGSILNDGYVKGDWALYIKDSHPNVQSLQGQDGGAALSDGIKDSIRNSILVKYNDEGDPYKIYINNSSAPRKWAEDIRKGDLVEVQLLDATTGSKTLHQNTYSTTNTFESYVDSVIGNSVNTIITLQATASAAYSSSFTLKTNPNLVTYYETSANIQVKSNPNPDNILSDWEIQFVNDYEVGAQIGYKKDDGFDTGLRVVSVFRNANWKSGIWTNGIYESGIYEGGIWYDGIFKGTWS